LAFASASLLLEKLCRIPFEISSSRVHLFSRRRHSQEISFNCVFKRDSMSWLAAVFSQMQIRKQDLMEVVVLRVVLRINDGRFIRLFRLP
jgi:hypothetical protein